jgi:hypothetical protein
MDKLNPIADLASQVLLTITLICNRIPIFNISQSQLFEKYDEKNPLFVCNSSFLNFQASTNFKVH